MKKVAYTPPNTIAHPKKRVVLRELATHGLVLTACAAAKVSRTQFYQWTRDDEEFAQEVKRAQELHTEYLEKCADERAARAKKPSDLLLIFRLKALRPDVYRERHEITLTRQEREARIAELLARRGSIVSPTAEGSTNGHIRVEEKA